MENLFVIARQQVDDVMHEQFREAPDAATKRDRVAPRASVVTSTRVRLSAGLRALAAAIEPRQSLTPRPSGSNR